MCLSYRTSKELVLYLPVEKLVMLEGLPLLAVEIQNIFYYDF